MILYLLTNTVNGMQYVGITRRNVTVRLRDHAAAARGGRQTVLAHAFRTYGHAAFQVQVLGEAPSWEQLTRMEHAAIGLYKTYQPHGYNMTRGRRKVWPKHCRAGSIAGTVMG